MFPEIHNNNEQIIMLPMRLTESFVKTYLKVLLKQEWWYQTVRGTTEKIYKNTITLFWGSPKNLVYLSKFNSVSNFPNFIKTHQILNQRILM